MRKAYTIALLILGPLVAFAKPLATAELKINDSPNIKVYAFEKVLDRWGDKEWIYFSDLISRESNWKSESKNPNGVGFEVLPKVAIIIKYQF